MTFKEYLEERWYESRKEPRNEVSKYGYFDAEKLLSKSVWVHTNRTNRDESRNGMFGVYIPSGKSRSEHRYGYTNEIRINNVTFDVNKTCAKIKDAKKRTLCAGVLGNVINSEGDNSGYIPFSFDPLGEVIYFFVPSDSQKRKLASADEAYFLATEDGKYTTLLKNPKFINETGK